MNDVFILGAGFSKAIFNDMPLLRHLSQELLLLVPELNATHLPKAFPDDCEMWLTHLALNHPWLTEPIAHRNRGLFVEVSRHISSLIETAQQTAIKNKRPDWIKPLVEKWHAERVRVLTFNYDTLVERFASLVQAGHTAYWPYHLSWFDLYPLHMNVASEPAKTHLEMQKAQASFRLFKLHGSIDWVYAGRSPSRSDVVYFTPTKSCAAPDWDQDWIQSRREIAHMTPLIVPPLSEKSTYYDHHIVQTVWNRAFQAMEQADRVFCIGYSLPISDLTMRLFMHDAGRTKRVKLYVVNLDSPDIRNRYTELLQSTFDLDFTYLIPDATAKFAVAYAAGTIP